MIVKCPWVKHGKFCKKTGYLILEKPRKKGKSHYDFSLIFSNKHHPLDPGKRPRGRYFRVHHYVYDDHGRRKSEFCYLGNFESALKKLQDIEKILGGYAGSEKINKPIYNGKWFVWELDSLKEIHDTIIIAKKLESFKDKPDRYAEIIFNTISAAQFYLIRGDKIFRMYA